MIYQAQIFKLKDKNGKETEHLGITVPYNQEEEFEDGDEVAVKIKKLNGVKNHEAESA